MTSLRTLEVRVYDPTGLAAVPASILTVTDDGWLVSNVSSAQVFGSNLSVDLMGHTSSLTSGSVVVGLTLGTAVPGSMILPTGPTGWIVMRDKSGATIYVPAWR